MTPKAVLDAGNEALRPFYLPEAELDRVFRAMLRAAIMEAHGSCQALLALAENDHA